MGRNSSSGGRTSSGGGAGGQIGNVSGQEADVEMSDRERAEYERNSRLFDAQLNARSEPEGGAMGDQAFAQLRALGRALRQRRERDRRKYIKASRIPPSQEYLDRLKEEKKRNADA